MSESVDEKLGDLWRMMCPQHHHQLQDQQGPTVYCKRCNHAYRYEDLIDKEETQSYAVVGER
ncbi:hypothetical protein EGH21_21340 [Halomicroarcula sp. F13]|uniref:Uncharacterized protein n=1 Tax=Haloarcula rubra TaxID=2487747 RepID=A0AAW4PZ56_9EURY|nr:hypothetical protein [Halomicroarcula rubra]MBX0325572.1 hypothetical protein [Halomicroarcula rubra]